MKKSILLVCGAGISTSIIVRLLHDIDIKEDFVFSCCDINSAPIKILENDLIILAPHVKFMQKKLDKICSRYEIPMFVINSSDYMSGDTEKLITQCRIALKLEEVIQTRKIVFLYERMGYLTQTILTSEAFQALAKSRKWIIEAFLVDDYMHSKDVDCIMIEPHLSYYTADYFKNRNFNHQCPFVICPALAYLDNSGRTMEKTILKNLK